MARECGDTGSLGPRAGRKARSRSGLPPVSALFLLHHTAIGSPTNSQHALKGVFCIDVERGIPPRLTGRDRPKRRICMSRIWVPARPGSSCGRFRPSTVSRFQPGSGPHSPAPLRQSDSAGRVVQSSSAWTPAVKVRSPGMRRIPRHAAGCWTLQAPGGAGSRCVPVSSVLRPEGQAAHS